MVVFAHPLEILGVITIEGREMFIKLTEEGYCFVRNLGIRNIK